MVLWIVVMTAALVTAAVLLYAQQARRRALGLQARLRRAEQRRDRFLAEVASELQAPLGHLSEHLLALQERPERGRMSEFVREVDEMTVLVRELARLPQAPLAPHEAVDLAELLREVVAAPPFSESGPPVILRAAPAHVSADRGRLLNGLRILLWVLRREASEIVITVSTEDEGAYVEILAPGADGAVAAWERMPAFAYGVEQPGSSARPGTTLALRVAAEIALKNGGRLAAGTRPGHANRFTLQWPAST